MTERPDPRRLAAETIHQAILAALDAAGPERSITPSDVAQAIDPEAWRSLLTRIRQEAAVLARQGAIEILRKGKPVPPEAMHGVIRLRRPPQA